LNKIVHELSINYTTLNEKKNSIDNDIKRLLGIKTHHQNEKDEIIQRFLFIKIK